MPIFIKGSGSGGGGYSGSCEYEEIKTSRDVNTYYYSLERVTSAAGGLTTNVSALNGCIAYVVDKSVGICFIVNPPSSSINTGFISDKVSYSGGVMTFTPFTSFGADIAMLTMEISLVNDPAATAIST